MIILGTESAILRNLLERCLDPNEILSEAYNWCDFDGVTFTFKILRPKKSKSKDKDKEEEETNNYPLRVEMNLPCWEQIKEYGSEERYEELYSKWKVDPSEGFTHAVSIELYKLSAAEQKSAISVISSLKSNLLGAPFLWVAKKIDCNENFAPFEIPYRAQSGESIFVCPGDKGAVAIFTIRFSDPGDHIIGGVFLNELTAARTRVPNAPAVSYSPNCPKELDAFELRQGIREGKEYEFVSMLLQNPQLCERKRIETSLYVPMFRNYLHYHIKCTKAFLHQKMRNRAAMLLKVLNQAKPEPKVKVYRTVTGKVVGQNR